jgi:hypothetical protein
MDFMDDVRDWSMREANRFLVPSCHHYRIASRRAHNRLIIVAMRNRIERVIHLGIACLRLIRFSQAERLPPLVTQRRP